MLRIEYPLILAYPGNEELASDLAESLAAERGRLAVHQFPDGEISVRVDEAAEGRDVILACTLDQPNEKLLALYLAACTLRTMHCRRIVLAAPYLPYMRQDRCFHAGEGVSAVHIADWLSGFLDGLVTAEPHLHRIHRLEQIYRIPTRVVHTTSPVARWIREQVNNPVLVGPDAESRQWVAAVAREVPCPYLIFDKVRFGDRDVELRLEGMAKHQDSTPVILDDIISSAATMEAAIRQLRNAGFPPPLCIGIHGLFSQGAYEHLRHLDVQNVVTCNSVRHISNQIDLNRLLALAVRDLLRQTPALPAAGLLQLPGIDALSDSRE